MVPGLVEPGIRKDLREGGASAWTDGILVLILLYLFLFALKLMGASFKMLGADFTHALFKLTSNPFAGLFVGVLATAIVQSSSLTTSITVALVAEGSLGLAAAVPVIMGANIGTSVTNTLVSLAHIRRRDEFRRAFAGAIVHDLFNWCTVLVFFPLELATGYLAKVSTWLREFFVGVEPVNALKPLDLIIKPLVQWVETVFTDVFGLPTVPAAILMAVLSLLVLFVVLGGMTRVLKKFVVGRLERVIDHYLFRYAILSYLLGMAATAVVQSSSVTTSLVVPLLGAGLLTLEQVYPYTLGANVGTTITAFLAALAFISTKPEAFTIALVHLLFNVHGALIFYPLRAIPIGAARWYANLAARRTRYAVLFIVVVFFLLPLVAIALSKLALG